MMVVWRLAADRPSWSALRGFMKRVAVWPGGNSVSELPSKLATRIRLPSKVWADGDLDRGPVRRQSRKVTLHDAA